MLVIFAWPAVVFGYVLFDLHRSRRPAEKPAPAAATAPEPVAPAWQPSVSTPA
jgi:hypothetical protein